MNNSSIRVRFAPSPTGVMHLGNVRAALINYLFAKQKNGTFILRIEDTDEQRNVDPRANKIMADLSWLHLEFDEGPGRAEKYGPYYQSERTEIYKTHLEILKTKNLVYRCFCTQEELERKRQRQLALKLPPKYDRTCLNLPKEKIEENLAKNMPFIWRFKLDSTKKVNFFDLGHKNMSFDLSHFSDFALTRQDGSFTFMFANFVDDMVMKISHIFRGEDHLTNTAGQVALYEAFNAPIPVFWHLPIIINHEGKKLSKRDFGFSLDDLKNSGFIPEAICNYLAIIGGSFKKEIMNLEGLSKELNFEEIASTSKIRYDLEKLRWVNHSWLKLLDIKELAVRTRPFIENRFASAKNLTEDQLESLLKFVHSELFTLVEAADRLAFYFERPKITQDIKENLEKLNISEFKDIIKAELKSGSINNPQLFINNLQATCKQKNLASKSNLYGILRISLMGIENGPSIKDLISMLGTQEATERILSIL